MYFINKKHIHTYIIYPFQKKKNSCIHKCILSIKTHSYIHYISIPKKKIHAFINAFSHKKKNLSNIYHICFLLALVGYCDDLMKPTKWRCSRSYDHMWNAWRFHEDWRLGV